MLYSHETALSLYDLYDLDPAKLHMTVPTGFWRNSEIPGVLVLHFADLPEADIQTAQGFKFTRPLRTILDLIEADAFERNLIRQAVRQGGRSINRSGSRVLGGSPSPLPKPDYHNRSSR